MLKVFRTFWFDNKPIFCISLVIFTILTVLFASTAISLQSLSTTPSGNLVTFIIIFTVLYISIFLYLPSILSMFIAMRTLTRKNALRYNMLTTSRGQLALGSLLVYIVWFALFYGVSIFSWMITYLLFEQDLQLFTSIFKDLLRSILYSKLLAALVLSNIIILNLTTFFYWNIMFLLPKTKVLRQMTQAIRIIILIGGYTLFHVLSFVAFGLSVDITSAQMGFLRLLIVNSSILILLATLYYYMYIDQYEI